MSWQFVHRACVHASVNSFLVSAIETTYLNQSGPNLHEVFMGTDEFDNEQNPPKTWKLFALELLKIAVLNLVSTIETTFFNQSGPKLHKVFIGTRSQMSWIMREIRLVTPKLFALELLKIVMYVYSPFVGTLATTFIDGF